MRTFGTIGARELVWVLAIAAVGAAGAWPGERGEPDPLALLVWLALIAPASGFACGALRLRLWPAAAVVPAAWMFLVGIVDALSESRDLSRPVWASCALAGMFAAAFGLGRVSATKELAASGRIAAAALRNTGLVLLVTALASALPFLGEHLRTPPSASVNAHLLDIAPTTLATECAGVDWMRHPPIYDAASTADIDPGLRTPYDGRLAGGLVFVVGCALAWCLERVARRRDERWPSTATSAPSPRS